MSLKKKVKIFLPYCLVKEKAQCSPFAWQLPSGCSAAQLKWALGMLLRNKPLSLQEAVPVPSPASSFSCPQYPHSSCQHRCSVATGARSGDQQHWKEEIIRFLSHQVPCLVHCTVIWILVLMKERWWCKDGNELPGVYGVNLLHFSNSVGVKYLLS